MKKLGRLKFAYALVVFCAAAASVSPAQTLKTLYTFCTQSGCSDGDNPTASLVQGTDGNFYGITPSGGADPSGFYCGPSGCGTVFQITPQGAFTTLYSFCAQSGCTDGGVPAAPLIQGTDGNFYGTTWQGGVSSGGTIFSITPAGALTTIYSFCSDADCTDGSGPQGALFQASDGSFYGTTYGSGGVGTVFNVTTGGTMTTLYNFSPNTGVSFGGGSYAGLAQGSDGNFYGTTPSGGANNDGGNCFSGCGTVFQITPSGTLTTIYSFCAQTNCSDGLYPYSGLVLGANGNFYGTTIQGGAYNAGTVFSISTAGVLTTVYSFCRQTHCPDGFHPAAGLTLALDGNFYGTTVLGGASDNGTVFKITPSGTLTTLYSFCSLANCADGNDPTAAVIQGLDGNFYGTTQYSGSQSSGYGTVFSLIVGQPAVSPMPTFLTFASQILNTTSNPKSVTITNTGVVVLNINSITTTANFGISANTCTATLAVGKKCVVSVTFTPTSTGQLAGSLILSDDAPGSPQLLGVSGAGAPHSTTTVLSTTPNPSTYGQSVLLSATVTSSVGAPPDGDTVNFMLGNSLLGSGTLTGGTATLSYSALAAGTKSVNATYNGDANFATSKSKAVNQVVALASTTTALASSLNPSIYGQTVVLTATVTPQYSGTPTGTVTFYNGSTKLGTGTVFNGIATYTTAKLAVGTDSITASYAGSTSFTSSSSSPVSQVVSLATPPTTVISSLNPSHAGQSVVFTATVSPQYSGTPTGYVTFTDGITTLKITSLNGIGQASYSISALAIGTHNITATYDGNSNYSMNSASLTQTVNP